MHLTEERVKRVQREADLNKIYSEALNSFENSLPDELANMIDNVKIVNDRIEIIAKPSKEDKIIDSLIVLVREIKNLKLVIGSEEGMYSGINYGGFNVEVIKSIIPKENDGQKPLRVGKIKLDELCECLDGRHALVMLRNYTSDDLINNQCQKISHSLLKISTISVIVNRNSSVKMFEKYDFFDKYNLDGNMLDVLIEYDSFQEKWYIEKSRFSKCGEIDID